MGHSGTIASMNTDDQTSVGDASADRRRLAAEGDYRSMEEAEDPKDLLEFYLRNLEIAASHLVDLTEFLAAQARTIKISEWDIFSYIEACARRVDELAVRHHLADQSWEAWLLLRRAVSMIGGWAGRTARPVDVARILFVSSVTLRQLYNSPRSAAPSGVERGFQICADLVPFRVRVHFSAAERAQALIQNLGWLCDELAADRRAADKHQTEDDDKGEATV